jgi:5-methylcytosine-specific restriction endonuclease McrA
MAHRLRLGPTAYRELCLRVLERDGWRCQHCGSMEDLQVHHIQWRSRQGNDTEENLMTLCWSCHSSHHGIATSYDESR